MAAITALGPCFCSWSDKDVEEVKWIGLETAKRLHKDEEGVIFIDVRDRRDFVAGHIADAYCTPLPEIIEP